MANYGPTLPKDPSARTKEIFRLVKLEGGNSDSKTFEDEDLKACMSWANVLVLESGDQERKMLLQILETHTQPDWDDFYSRHVKIYECCGWIRVTPQLLLRDAVDRWRMSALVRTYFCVKLGHC
jgi:hypothetical protein